MKIALVFSMVAFVAAGCATSPVAEGPATVAETWVGTVVLEGRSRTPDPSSATGYRGQFKSWAPASDASPIRAGVGTSMGVAYILSNIRAGGPIPVQVTWTFPPPGIRTHGIATGALQSSDRGVQYCSPEQECLAAWSFAEPWEVVPGTWTVELAVAGKTFLRRQLEVVSQ